MNVLPANMQAKIQLRPCADLGTDCWEWTGAINSKGYGCTSLQGRSVLAHRRAYQLIIGDIPDGLQIDHLCLNKRCCNPAHLEAVTGKVNMQRARAVTHCIHGHEYTPENTLHKKHGQRNCRTCANQWQRHYRLKAAA